MKKILVVGAILAVLVVAVVGVGVVYAQRQTPGQGIAAGSGWAGGGMMNGRGPRAIQAQGTAVPNQNQSTNTYGPGYGRGMMGGGFGAGYGWMANGDYGPMHDDMIAALASQIGLTPEELQAQIDSGKTPYQILADQGKTADQISEILEAAHDQALKQAVADGTLTQDQADWMDSRMNQMWQYGGGRGGCMGGWQGTTTNQ